MRRLFAVAALAALLAGCTDNPAPEKKDAMAAAPAADSLHYPYKATYSSAFTMGDPANAKIVLDIWKAYETNKLGDTKSLFADSVTMEFSDGFFLHTSRDSLIAGGNADRAQYASVIDSVEAWQSIHLTDKNEDWVAVWAREWTASNKGKKDTAAVHEIWQLKGGKVTYMAQYRGKRKMYN
ncbi:MAG TPA: hypothetical protein VLD19_11350 [Chitinophagaceae bacterium]|nr:hypothetical protein [Chitinophagaceae bacterium]